MKKSLISTALILVAFLINAENYITIEDIYKNRKFSPATVHGINSMSDGIHYTSLNNSRTKIKKYKYSTGEKVKTYLDINDFENELLNRIFSYSFNEDYSKVLFSVRHEQIYRYSYKAEFFVFDINNNELMRLSENGKQQLASFSPDGKKIAFVRDNNIYVSSIESNNITEQQLTSDGEKNNIINGAPDWVYEEEFSFSKAFHWSLCSKKIAFLKTDESHVKTYNIVIYGEIYPEIYSYKYPKAGEENSVVSVHVIDIETKKVTDIDIGQNDDIYIPRIAWTPYSDKLSIVKLNRLQNDYKLYLADANSGESELILNLKEEKYIEIDNNLSFLDDREKIVFTDEKSGFNHIYLYDLAEKQLMQITSGNWDVTDFYGYDPNNNLIYFQAAKDSPFVRGVYSIDIDGENLTKLSEKQGSNRFVFSEGFKYYINYYSNYHTPLYISLHNIQGDLIRVLEDNEHLIEKTNEYNFINKEFFSFATEDDVELHGWMIKPPDFDEEKQYPVFMYVYGGPGSQTVMDSYDRRMAWWQLLAQKGYIVVSVDNRGTGGRGQEFRQLTYEQLGRLETIDQINAAKYLSNKKYIDEKRIGIFGWSYGGYISSLCMTLGADFFKLGIAVAPVTSWRYYDTIYTERYNGLPQDNAAGYDDNSPINYAEKLKGKFLLLHGTNDDNVHVENSIDFANELINAGKDFEFMLYPNKNHALSGEKTQVHVYNTMTEFILNNL